ncbi:MAG: hypothetical protein NTW25_12435 [Candidatus Kapabacteria bacterium]|nr:hypothetical protein [Candidatus Kapabacteria bacterium]
MGFKVIRFTNEEVFGIGNMVESKIRNEVIILAGNTLRTPPQPYPNVSKSRQNFKTGREEPI